MARHKDGFHRRQSNTRTSLRRKKRSGHPMAAYDQLPTDLRLWLIYAALPWSPRSALRVWRNAVKQHGEDRDAIFACLNQLETMRLRKEAATIWSAQSNTLHRGVGI